jgi:translation initiation factor IF-2
MTVIARRTRPASLGQQQVRSRTSPDPPTTSAASPDRQGPGRPQRRTTGPGRPPTAYKRGARPGTRDHREARLRQPPRRSTPRTGDPALPCPRCLRAASARPNDRRRTPNNAAAHPAPRPSTPPAAPRAAGAAQDGRTGNSARDPPDTGRGARWQARGKRTHPRRTRTTSDACPQRRTWTPTKTEPRRSLAPDVGGHSIRGIERASRPQSGSDASRVGSGRRVRSWRRVD